MRIHTDLLTPLDLYTAIDGMDRVRVDYTTHGSRSRDHAFEVRLTGTSPYRTMDKQDNAATWDEWGVFMARLFAKDPRAVMNKETAKAFYVRTGDRFAHLSMPDDTHPRHTWDFIGPRMFKCRKCTAVLDQTGAW